jgi:phosphoglycolate phosphatase-like HAD superfamily hydrolase
MTDPNRLLLLFDIDGTLLSYGGAREHAAALVSALSEVYDVDLPADAVSRVGPYGKTDQRIAREILAGVGIHGAEADARRAAWIARTAELYQQADLRRLANGAAPGAAAALAWAAERGHTLALLTGNIEPVAHLKLAAAGLGEWFARGEGAFGSDAEDRNELVPVALQRAGGARADRAVVIGDAPADVACALAAGARAIAITGHFTASDLDGAHALITGLSELPGALDELVGGGGSPGKGQR